MRYLIDTHAFIWFTSEDERLSRTAKRIIESPDSQLLFSMASIWEIAIKMSIGKLEIDGGLETVIGDLAFYEMTLLPIALDHVEKLISLNYHHKDPFDRMLIAQSICENAGLVSAEVVFDDYLIEELPKRIW